MADESILRAVRAGKSYGDLPQRARDLISRSHWNRKVMDACAKKRIRWSSQHLESLREACKEGEYYSQVIKLSTAAQQVFPYHLVPSIKVTPFKYYIGMLHSLLKADQSYAQVPNFTAADMLRVIGIGRDQYVPLLQACKAKRILWKVNRDSAIRDQLPKEPVDLMVEPWWQLRCLQTSKGEKNSRNRSASTSASSWAVASSSYSSQDQELTEAEETFLTDLSKHPMVIDDVQDPQMWKRLYRRGLVHIDVPIGEDDCIAVPPLEGFVSNKDGDEDSDPVEKLLYGMFFAASARTTIRELAHVLDAPISEVREAASVACRLGFARRTTQERRTSISNFLQSPSELTSEGTVPGSELNNNASSLVDHNLIDTADSGRGGGSQSQQDMNEPKGIAFVVDTEVTATLMMGSLLKDQRHAVTLFEAGKLSGRLAVRELLDELSRVPSTGEGEIQFLVDQIQSLQRVLNLICAVEASADQSGAIAGSERPPPEIDILRYEVLADLPHSTLKRMFSQHYFLVVFMARCPLPLLQVPISREGPVVHGLPSEMAAMPWMQLLLLQELENGLVSIAFPKGMQLRSLPNVFSHVDRLLIEYWPEEGGSKSERIFVEGSVALGVINHTLLSSAILVQKVTEAVIDSEGKLVTVDVALPLSAGVGDESFSQHGDIHKIVEKLKLVNTIGYLTLLRVTERELEWKVKNIHFGMPLHSVDLCRRVCESAKSIDILSSHASSILIKEKLEALSSEYMGSRFLPTVPILFDGKTLSKYNTQI